MNETRRFPQELVDHVIDHLHYDPNSLQHCSTVSKGWTHAAQFHMFQTILIQDGTQLVRFAKLVESCPHLAMHVRTLCLKTYRHYMSPISAPYLLNWIRDVPQTLSGKLPRVRALEFQHVQWDILQVDGAFAASLRDFAHVQDLTFKFCKFSRFQDFELLVLSFQGLKRLALDIVSWKNDRQALTSPSVSPETPRPHLKELRIGRFCAMSTIFDWALRTPARYSLRNLEFRDIVTKEELVQVGRLLKTLGNQVQHLKLGCNFDHMQKLQSCEFCLRNRVEF